MILKCLYQWLPTPLADLLLVIWYITLILVMVYVSWQGDGGVFRYGAL